MSAIARDESQKRVELASFLKARRARIAPADVGVSASARRRAPGLLRDEVAQLAGISVTWYTWMEQARPTNPSPRVLDNLAEALRLDAGERAHLFRLARPDLEPASAYDAMTATIPPSLRAIMDGLASQPAYALDARWNVLGWNAAADRLFDFASTAPSERNLLHLLFLDAGWRALFVDWPHVAEAAVAQFRAQTATLADDPEIVRMVASLRAASREFAALWSRQDVRPGASWRKRIAHPELGALSFDYSSLRVDGADGLRLTIYMASSDDGSAKRFDAMLARR